jgi:cardiolipin synthase
MSHYLIVSDNILKNIPNALTVFRLLLIIPFLMCLYQKDYDMAFYLYLLAGITDGLDGWLARHFRWLSPLGSFMDPLADKLLVVSSFIALALIGSLPWWLVTLVFMRDLTISLGVLAWFKVVSTRIDFNPSILSKINTTVQLVLVTLCLFELAFFNLPSYYVNGLIIITALTTAVTYVNYVWIWSIRAWFLTRKTQ